MVADSDRLLLRVPSAGENLRTVARLAGLRGRLAARLRQRDPHPRRACTWPSTSTTAACWTRTGIIRTHTSGDEPGAPHKVGRSHASGCADAWLPGMKRILIKPFAWHLTMLIIGVLAAPSSALGWSILATASPFRLRVRHLIAILAVVLLLSFVPRAPDARHGAPHPIRAAAPPAAGHAAERVPTRRRHAVHGRARDARRHRRHPPARRALIPFLIGLIRGRKDARPCKAWRGARAQGAPPWATTSGDGYGWAPPEHPGGAHHNHRRVSRRSFCSAQRAASSRSLATGRAGGGGTGVAGSGSGSGGSGSGVVGTVSPHRLGFRRLRTGADGSGSDSAAGGSGSVRSRTVRPRPASVPGRVRPAARRTCDRRP